MCEIDLVFKKMLITTFFIPNNKNDRIECCKKKVLSLQHFRLVEVNFYSTTKMLI